MYYNNTWTFLGLSPVYIWSNWLTKYSVLIMHSYILYIPIKLLPGSLQNTGMYVLKPFTCHVLSVSFAK
jgi:hypothetical protein